MDKDRGLVRAAASISLVTTLSRFAGYARDNLQAAILGAADSSDAFVIAFRIPNMLRRLFGEGALTSAFVPTLARYMQAGDKASLWRFVGSIVYLLSLALTAVVVLGVIFSPLLVQALAWGFAVDPDKFSLTVSLNRWMFPYIFLISLAALFSGILNSFDVFTLPAFTPVLLNLSIITCALFLADHFTDPAYAFATGVLVGGCLQLAIQVPPLLRRGFVVRFPRPIDLSGVKEIGRLMLPRIFGAGITQMNLVVDSQFATSLRAGSVSFLYYAIRVTELTLGVFAISLSTVLLPSLSRAAASGDRARVLRTLTTASRLLVFVTLPASIGLVLLRQPIIHTLFERGRFTLEDTMFTSSALGYYSLGLLPFAAISVLAAAFYAHQDTRTPVWVGAATFFLHIGLNFALREPMAHNGIALSTSISALVGAVLLAWILRSRYGDYLGREVVISLLQSVAAAVVMGGVLFYTLTTFDFLALPGIASKAIVLAGLVLGGALLYLGVAFVLGSGEVRLLLSVFREEGEKRS